MTKETRVMASPAHRKRLAAVRSQIDTWWTSQSKFPHSRVKQNKEPIEHVAASQRELQQFSTRESIPGNWISFNLLQIILTEKHHQI